MVEDLCYKYLGSFALNINCDKDCQLSTGKAGRMFRILKEQLLNLNYLKRYGQNTIEIVKK